MPQISCRMINIRRVLQQLNETVDPMRFSLFPKLGLRMFERWRFFKFQNKTSVRTEKLSTMSSCPENLELR